jgi:hypothetical protein
MNSNFHVRVSLNELKTRYDVSKKKSGYSEPALRKFIQHNVIASKKVSYLESLLEFSAIILRTPDKPVDTKNLETVETVFENLNCSELFTDHKLGMLIKKVYKLYEIENDSFKESSSIPSTFEVLADCLNYIFIHDEQYDELIPNLNWKNIYNLLETFYKKHPNVQFINEFKFLEDILYEVNVHLDDDELEYQEDSEKEIRRTIIRHLNLNVNFNALSKLNKKIFVRFCLAIEPNIPLQNPFKQLPQSLLNLKGVDPLYTNGPRATEQYFYHMPSLIRYKSTTYDPYVPAMASNFLNQIKTDTSKWTSCFTFNLKDHLQKDENQTFATNPDNPLEIKLNLTGNLLWFPEHALFIKKPDKIIESIKQISGYTGVNILVFLPRSFLKTKVMDPLRSYLLTNANIKEVIVLEFDNPPTKTIAVLFQPIKPTQKFKPNYCHLTDWKTLFAYIQEYPNGNQLNKNYLFEALETKSEDEYPGCWVPIISK